MDLCQQSDVYTWVIVLVILGGHNKASYFEVAQNT